MRVRLLEFQLRHSRIVAATVRSLLNGLPFADGGEALSDETLLDRYLDRVTLYSGHLALEFHAPGSSEPKRTDVTWTPPPGRPKREILLPHKDSQKDHRPIKSEVRESVVKAIALGRKWLSELISNPQLTMVALAEREGRSKRSISMLLSLNFVAPDIVRALIMGKLPRGISITKLVHLPADWSQQREQLGIAGQ